MGLAALLPRVGRGLYVKSELTWLFPMPRMVKFVETFLDPAARPAAAPKR